MARPPGYRWQPLGLDADPVPGDPQAISAETAHLASVAATITGQVAAMHKIASDDTGTGQHAETIRTAARRQAASLQAVATRYARVSSALSGWVPELEQAVSAFTTKALGTGLRTMRHKEADGTVVAMLGFAFPVRRIRDRRPGHRGHAGPAAAPEGHPRHRGLHPRDERLPQSGATVMNAVSELPARPGPTVLRVPAVRWMIAELVPFGCLAIGFAIAREWRPAATLGYLLALFGMPILTAFYLYKVLGAAIGWVVPLIPLSIATTWAGAVTIAGSAIGRSPQNPGGTKIEATSSWFIAVGCLAAIVAGIVAAAAVNGERWMRHNRYNLPRNKFPRNKFEAYARSRGTLAWLWLPR